MTVPTARYAYHGPESGSGPGHLIPSIANIIIEYFRRGIATDDDTLFFAVSTLGVTDEKEIAGLMGEADWNGEALRDLILAPPPLLRTAIEMLIPPEGMSAEASADVCRLILGSLKNTGVSFGKNGHTAMVDLSEPAISRFVARLNLDRRVMVPSIASAAGSANREFYARMRVVMRNARHTTSPEREKFLSEMIDRMVSDDRIREETILDCLSFMLGLFGEFGENADIYTIISEKKRSFEALVSDIADYQEYSEKYSMDFLMSKKIHRPVIDREDVMKKLGLADLICMTVYGVPADSERRR